MTKKEQAMVEAMRQEIALLKAWRLTEKVEPDVPKPERGYSFGWEHHAHELSYRARPTACNLSSHWHSKEDLDAIRANPNKYHAGGYQNSFPLHSTKSRALRAARYEMEQAALKALAKIDREIEEAEAEEQAK